MSAEGHDADTRGSDLLAKRQRPEDRELVIAVMAPHRHQQQAGQQPTLQALFLMEIGLLGPTTTTFHPGVPFAARPRPGAPIGRGWSEEGRQIKEAVRERQEQSGHQLCERLDCGWEIGYMTVL